MKAERWRKGRTVEGRETGVVPGRGVRDRTGSSPLTPPCILSTAGGHQSAASWEKEVEVQGFKNPETEDIVLDHASPTSLTPSIVRRNNLGFGVGIRAGSQCCMTQQVPSPPWPRFPHLHTWGTGAEVGSMR